MATERIWNEAYLLERLTAHRRALHQIPEMGYDLPKTHAYCMSALRQCCPDELRVFAQTGIRAVFSATGARRTIAFRSDMDALPIQEPAGCAWRSCHEGAMHACGHDGHMANLLALAEWIAAHRAAVRCNVVLIFQPAEETTGGAQRMIEEGVLQSPDVDAIYGMHMMPDVPKGKIALCPGPIMAQTCELNFDLTGRSAHGAAPHMGRDAAVAMAYLITMLQTVVSRSVNPAERAVITIGRVQAGTQRNIIADKARLEGICRTFSNAVFEGIEDRIKAICRGTAMAFDVDVCYQRGVYYPCTNNDPDETCRVAALLGENALEAQPRMTAEDFSYYQLKVPGVFVFCGCRDDRFGAPLHSEQFGFDEAALLAGNRLFRHLIEQASEER